MADYMLQVKGLKTYYYTEEGVVPAVDGLDFEVAQGETFAIVGESGCGKSVTSLSILGLIPNPPGKIIAGEILYNGEDLLKKTEKQMRAIRGNEISMIFQEPMTSLNPVFTVGRQISESFKYHQHLGKKEARNRAIEMLRLVGIPSPDKVVDDYPHQLSGGMRQRVMIAMALACNPRVLIADEPTTALDVTIQAQILDMMRRLQEELGTTVLLISHDLGVVAGFCDRVAVMYAGRIVELGRVEQVFGGGENHPYTRGLLRCAPDLGELKPRLEPIPGHMPEPTRLPPGCAFAERCPECTELCRRCAPAPRERDGHLIACHHRWKEG